MKKRGPRAPQRPEESISLDAARKHMSAAMQQIERADDQMLRRTQQVKGLVGECVKKIEEAQELFKALALMAQNEDRPLPAKVYCAVWVSRSTLGRYVKDGMQHDYHEGHLTVTPREFFKYYHKSRSEKPSRGPDPLGF